MCESRVFCARLDLLQGSWHIFSADFFGAMTQRPLRPGALLEICAHQTVTGTKSGRYPGPVGVMDGGDIKPQPDLQARQTNERLSALPIFPDCADGNQPCVGLGST